MKTFLSDQGSYRWPRSLGAGLLALTVGLVGCTTGASETTLSTAATTTPASEVDDPGPAPVGEQQPAAESPELSASITVVGEPPADVDRARDPAVVCHWAGDRYVTIVVSVQAAENGHGNHERDVIFLHTDDETLCEGVTTTTAPPETTTLPPEPTTTAPPNTTLPPETTTTAAPIETTTLPPETTTTAAPTTTVPPETTTTAAPTTTSPIETTTVPPESTTTTGAPESTTTSSSSAPDSTSTTDPDATTTTGANLPGEIEELPNTGVSIPTWALVSLGLGLLLAGFGMLRLTQRESDSARRTRGV